LLWQQQYTDILAILLDVHCMADLWFHGSLLYLVGGKIAPKYFNTQGRRTKSFDYTVVITVVITVVH